MRRPADLHGWLRHNQMTDPGDAKCSTFRLTHLRQLEEYAAAAEAGRPTAGPRHGCPLTPV